MKDLLNREIRLNDLVLISVSNVLRIGLVSKVTAKKVIAITNVISIPSLQTSFRYPQISTITSNHVYVLDPSEAQRYLTDRADDTVLTPNYYGGGTRLGDLKKILKLREEKIKN